MVRQQFLFIFAFLIVGIIGKTLFPDEEDGVINLTNESIDGLVYGSEITWFIVFYAHWCGHCRAFSSKWKTIGKLFKTWNNDTVQIGAYNCAEQSCSNFSIEGVPTVRLFYPNRDFGSLGEDIPTHSLYSIIEDMETFIENGQSNGKINFSNPDLTPYRETNLESELGKNDAEKYVFIIENEQNIGRRVITYFGSSDVLHIRYLDLSINLFLNSSITLLSLPAVIVLEPNYKNPENGGFETMYPSFESTDQAFDQVVAYLMSFIDPIIETPEEATVTNIEVVRVPVTPDLIYLSDLEKTLNYSLTVEIPSHEVIEGERLDALKMFLNSLIKYFEGTPRVNIFLSALEDWVSEKNASRITRDEYLEQVQILIKFFDPFLKTHSDWISCKGSEETYRGYPCGLWTLFHKLFVNSVVKKDLNLFYGKESTISQAMTNYIKYFFSCRKCAEHFEKTVRQMNYVPRNEEQSLLWLWKIHNKVNNRLRGDITEDPKHPKIIWPHRQNCPYCRDINGVEVDGEYWNLDLLKMYILQVYSSKNIIIS